MQSIDLGPVIHQFRMPRWQVVGIFVAAAAVGGFAGMVYWYDTTHVLIAVSAVLGAVALWLVAWGVKAAVSVMEVRERGVSMRLLLRRVELPYDQIQSVGMRQRTVNGLPGSYSGVWVRPANGKVVVFPLEALKADAPMLIEQMRRAAQSEVPQ